MEKENKAEKSSSYKHKSRCQHCGSENVYGVTRVVGYFSRIDNWNSGKKKELSDRQKGNYEV